MTFNTGSVKANDLQFSYIEKGEGPLLLCMHGFPDIPSTFRYQLDAFADQGFRVVAPYMRGYSPTEIPQNGFYQTVALGLDTLALIESLGYESAVLMGHDWGSSAVTAAAVLDPGKVNKLITCAVPYGSKIGEAFLLNPEQQRRSWYMFFFQLPLADLAVPINDFAFIERLWRDWSPGWELPMEELKAVQDTLAKPGVLAAALGYYRAIFNPANQDPQLADQQAKLSQPIEIPSLHIHGAMDGCIGVELTEEMESFFSAGLELAIVADAGHFVQQEKPDEFNRIVLESLGLS
jgi:pimeloyl-ACP methyl ester carboxylesterase